MRSVDLVPISRPIYILSKSKSIVEMSIRDGRYQLFRIDTIPIRYQGFSVVSIPNFDTDTIKYEPSSKVLL